MRNFQIRLQHPVSAPVIYNNLIFSAHIAMSIYQFHVHGNSDISEQCQGNVKQI
jgi:hypothetical protein